MNKLWKILRSPLLHFMIATIILLLCLWLAAPSITIDGNTPFATFMSRLIPTCIIGFAWFNYIVIKSIISNRHPAPLTAESATTLQHTITEDLQQDFHNTHKASKKNTPWFLLMGPPGSGKTTLLSQLPFELESPQHDTLNNATTTQWINWWVSDKAIFIDPAGKYALAQSNNPTEQAVWRSLVKTLKQHRRQAPLGGVLLTIDFATLCHNNNPTFNDLIENLIFQLQILKSLRQAISLTIIITQSDRIVGFNEFFEDLSDEDRQQPLGFNINASKRNVEATVEKQFEQFIKNLNARSLWRLHHEHSLHKRGLIQELPLQMEKIGQRLKTLTTQLPWSHQLILKGVYFVSNTQNQAPIDLLQTLPTTETFGLTQLSHTIIHNDQQKYFIDQLCERIVIQGQNQLNQHPTPGIKQLIAYPAAILMISGMTMIWHQSYQRNLSIADHILATLNMSHRTSPDLALPWLHQLNALANTLDTIQPKQSSFDTLAGLNQGQQLTTATAQHYHTLLQHQFLPYLTQTLTTALEQAKHHDNTKLYNALKVYMMLTHGKPIDTTFIQDWFKLQWQQQFASEPSTQAQLKQHLTQLLQLEPIPTTANEVLIDQAQNELRQLPATNQALLALQERYPLIPVRILSGFNPLETVDLSQAKVCSFCSSDHFQHIYNTVIPHVVDHISDANWVLNTKTKKPLSALKRQRLIKKLQAMYLDYYAKQWAEALPQIRLTPPQSISQAQTSIQLLNDPASPFWKLLQIVNDNITLRHMETQGNPINTPAVKTLTSLLNKNSELYQNTHYQLKQLDNYLFHINEITEIDKASFEAASKRMQNNGKDDPITALLQYSQQSPALIQPWLQAIAEGTWRALLNNTHQYLNIIWSTTVVPEYQQHIANRYPIFRQSSNNISINDFTHFFGPKGTVGNFFTTYLEPFINMDKRYWTWKTLDHESLTIPQKSLNTMIRASMIQQMFFTHDHQQPSTQFSLTPQQLANNTAGFTLNLGSQVVQFNQDQHDDDTLQWPPNNANFATILFNGKDGHAPSITISGPWALFRLLEQSNIQSTHNAREYQVEFKLQQYSAHFKLVADQLINPFVPGVIDKFRCPSHL